ncbi:MAG: hypothetical protein ABW202_02090 [Duganella sp.]
MDTSKQMPDLGAATQSDGDQRRRILAQLEHGPRVANATAVTSASNMRRWSVDGWTVGLVLLLLFMGSTAWLLQDQAHAPPRWKSQSARSQAAPGPETAAASPHSTSATPAEGTRHAAQAAVIISDPASAQTAAYTRAPAAPAADPINPISATIKSTATKPPSHSAGSSRTPSTAAATAPKPAKTPQKSTSGADTDVALLSALVAHAGKPAKVSPARSRDVVEADNGEATASLLARCQQLGPIEGMLCRSRICADRWDADPACRVPAGGVR